MTGGANPTIDHSDGTIVRVVDDLAYVSVDGNKRTLSFVPSVIENYAGEPLRVGTGVRVEWQPAAGLVTRLSVKSLPAGETTRADDVPLETTTVRAKTGGTQCELHPSRAAIRKTGVPRALSAATRRFGKLVDTSSLFPGDLLLSRELQPDGISELIKKVQAEGGYHADDARWTHAAMYVGDDANVVEATFDTMPLGSVRLTSLDEYCDGKYSLRFRRSRHIHDDRLRWRLCVRALCRLGRPYDFLGAASIWFKIVIRQINFYDSRYRNPTSSAVVCSTLYADSYNEATRRCLGEMSGVCVPAWLSVSDEFDDIQAEWLEI